jgi:hypothetical protein
MSSNAVISLRSALPSFFAFYELVGFILLIPAALLNVVLLIGSLVSFNPVAILFQLACVAGSICALRLLQITAKGRPYVLSKWRISGLIFVPLSGVLLLVLFFSQALGPFGSVYYYALGPTLFIALALMNRPRLALSEGVRLSAPAGRRCTISRLLAGVWLLLVFGLVLLSLFGAFSTHDFSQMAELINPLNIINWMVIVLLAAPALLLIFIANRGSNS